MVWRCAGLWWPFSSKLRMGSEWAVFVRRRRAAALGFAWWLLLSASESDSGTVSREGSFLCEHVHRPPWLQQQLSGNRGRKAQVRLFGLFLFFYNIGICIDFRWVMVVIIVIMMFVPLQIGNAAHPCVLLPSALDVRIYASSRRNRILYATTVICASRGNGDIATRAGLSC